MELNKDGYYKNKFYNLMKKGVIKEKYADKTKHTWPDKMPVHKYPKTYPDFFNLTNDQLLCLYQYVFSSAKTDETLSQLTEPITPIVEESGRYVWTEADRSYNGKKDDPDRIECDEFFLALFENDMDKVEKMNNIIYHDDFLKDGMFRKQLIKSSADLVTEITSKSFNTRVIRLSNTLIDGEPIQKIYVGADPDINLIYLAIREFLVEKNREIERNPLWADEVVEETKKKKVKVYFQELNHQNKESVKNIS
jgi:hypothetical protein